MSAYYINRRDRQFSYLETVDEFSTLVEANRMRAEYQLSDPAGHYYVSSRSTREWREANHGNR